jgi:hypothetical protein
MAADLPDNRNRNFFPDMTRLTKEQIKFIADRAEARSVGTAIDDDNAEWERGFGQACDKAERERSLEIIEAEIERLAQLSPIEYEIERRAAADRLDIKLSVIDGLVKAKRPKRVAKKTAPDIDADELERSAGHIIRHPNILELFAQDLGKVIAGEAVNGKLLYLVATSRLFDKPMNAAIKGTSAGGKSEIRKRVLQFFPPEDVITFTSLSEKSLIFHDGDFANKILSMGEATATDEQSFQDYLLRELMSEGCIRHSMAQKVGNDIRTVTIEKQGPVAFLVTTTKSKMHPENETRMLSLEIDDSEGQTKKVLDKVAKVDGQHDAAQVDYKPWQDFQRWLGLGECRVIVPFAKAMVDLIPPVAVRLRRDVGQVIRAIKAHALLHRDQRGRDDAGRIVADIEHDYATARKLMNAIIAESSGVAVNPAITETIDAVAKATIGMTEAEGANAKAVAKFLKLDRSAAYRRLTAACDEGYIVNLEQRQRMPGKYRVSGQKVEPIAILPTTAELAERSNDTQCPLPPQKPAHSCNWEEIPEVSLRDNECKAECKPSAECIEPSARVRPSANGLALVKSMDGNGKSPPVARVHDFSGDIDTHACTTEDFPQVCAHCGGPATADAPVQRCAVNGAEVLLHPSCQTDWLGAAQPADDLSIPPFLVRDKDA